MNNNIAESFCLFYPSRGKISRVSIERSFCYKISEYISERRYIKIKVNVFERTLVNIEKHKKINIFKN